ncbi:tetratricopeptide repeat protein [Pseudopedobacter beijingensis]|uniref:Tol-pal system YbgF family protein n=1 Tax=Pseudopedobacter beijingensis TaxID=1207056 RepID=A0ABW4IBD2_9SPHI
MFTNKARGLVCFLLALAGILAFYYQVYEISLLAAFFIGYVIWGYYKEGTVVLAARCYKNGDYQKSKELLYSIKNPSSLSKRRLPYYEFILGNIALKEMDYEEAEEHFSRAAFLGLRKGDIIACLLHLANISLKSRNKEKGLAWLAETENLPLTPRQKHIVENIEKELKKI